MKIKPEVQTKIDGFDLNPYAKKRVEIAVLRYSTPSGFCQTLGYICCKIKNFFLFFIGCSDWQRAVRACKNQSAKELKESLVLQNVNKKRSKEIMHDINPIYSKISAAEIEAMITQQNGKAITVKQKAKLDKLDQQLDYIADKYGLHFA